MLTDEEKSAIIDDHFNESFDEFLGMHPLMPDMIGSPGMKQFAKAMFAAGLNKSFDIKIDIAAKESRII